MDRREDLPDTIYLIPDNWMGDDCWVWTDDPTPTPEHDEAEAVKYTKIESSSVPACSTAPCSDEEINRLASNPHQLAQVIIDCGDYTVATDICQRVIENWKRFSNSV